MIIIGLGQMLAGILLVLSGAWLFQGGSPVIGVVDMVVGAVFLWMSIDRQDPPSRLIPLEG